MKKLIALALMTAAVGIAYAQAQKETPETFCAKAAEAVEREDAKREGRDAKPENNMKLIAACMNTQAFMAEKGPLPKGFKWQYCQDADERAKARKALMKIVVEE
ncbi:MAG: hypothetical protein WC943_15565 [Elusimicrobiota bacterium]|jgi:hypothetical protein